MLSILPMIDEITLIYENGSDDWGLPVVDKEEDVKGHFRFNTERNTIPTASGDEVTYTADVYFPVGTNLDYSTKLKYVTSEDTVEKTPLSIERKRDFWGKPVVIKVVV